MGGRDSRWCTLKNWLEANKWEDGMADDVHSRIDWRPTNERTGWQMMYTRKLIGGQQMGGRDSRWCTLENWLEANKWENGMADDVHSRIDWRPTNPRTGWQTMYTLELIGGQQMGGRDGRRYTLENWLEAGIADDIHSRIDWRPTNGRTGWQTMYTRELIGGQQMEGRDGRRCTLENWCLLIFSELLKRTYKLFTSWVKMRMTYCLQNRDSKSRRRLIRKIICGPITWYHLPLEGVHVCLCRCRSVGRAA